MVISETLLLGERANQPLDRNAVMADLQRRVPGLFDPNAPPNLFRGLLNGNPKALMYPTYGILKNPRIAYKVETGNPASLDHVYMHLSEYPDNNGWVFQTDSVGSGRYKLKIKWDGESGHDTSHLFQFHWAGFTPNTTVDLEKGLIVFDTDSQNPEIISIDALRKQKGQEILSEAQRLSHLKMKDLRVDPTRNRFTTSLVGYNNRPLLEVDLPLSIQVDLG